MISVPMSAAQFEAASARLRDSGVEIYGTVGTLTKDGITARYEHADGKLSIEITDKPFLLPLSVIEATLRAYIEQAASGGGAG